MPSQPPSVAETNNKIKNGAPAKPKQSPPEEQFWQRYSPHHEAPLSGIGSLAVHAFIVGLLIVAGILGWLSLTTRRAPLPNDVVSLEHGGGGGKVGGAGDNEGDGKPAEEVADTKQDQNLEPADKTKPERPDLKDPAVLAQSLPADVASDDSIKRFIKQGNENLASLAGLNQDIQSKLREGLRQAPAGKGGSGTGGGKGSGTGPGDGNSSGPGSGKISRREQRMLRWTMQFDTRSGADYLRQLKGLGAILAIPRDRSGRDFYVIRDLGGRPPKLLEEDVEQLQRIFWIDDKPQDVASILHALNLHERADRFVAFMPQELEQKLFDEELRYNHLREEEIDETVFQVRVNNRGEYYPVVVSQRRK
jgi:hypothetical protein